MAEEGCSRLSAFSPGYFLCIFFPFILCASDLFSRVNHFDLSYEHLYAKNRLMVSAQADSLFWSQPAEFGGGAFPHFLTFNNEDQQLQTGIFGIANGAWQSGEPTGFGALGLNVAYRSPHIDGDVRFSTYSTHRIDRPFLDDVAYERFMRDDDTPIVKGLFDFRFNLPQASLTFKYRGHRLSIGKQKLRWGPGYKGTLGLSGVNYAPFNFYNIRMSLGRLATFSSYLCGYDDEKEFAREITSAEKLTVVNNNVSIDNLPPRYGAAQRLDFRLGPHLQVGIYEMVQFFGSADVIRYANPLQLYFLGDQMGGSNNANVCGGIDINVFIRNVRFYGEFLNDDLTPFEHAGNPNNFGYQVGGELYLDKRVHTVGIEYVHNSRYLYTHSRALSRFTYWHTAIGWPWGNDLDYFNLRAIARPHEKIDARAEVTYAIKGVHPLDRDWYADGSPDVDFVDYWPEHGRHVFTVAASIRYMPFPWMSAELFVKPSWLENVSQHSVMAFLVVDVPAWKQVVVR